MRKQKFHRIDIGRMSYNPGIGTEQPEEKQIDYKKETDKAIDMWSDDIIQTGAIEYEVGERKRDG